MKPRFLETARIPPAGGPWVPPLGNRLFLAILLGLVLAYRFWWAWTAPLSGAEAQLWQCARHLDWGYFGQGPLAPWTAWLGLAAGEGTLALRLPFILASTALSLLAYEFCRSLQKDETLGLTLAAALNGSLLFGPMTACAHPLPVQGLSWAAAVYLTARASLGGRSWAWSAAGASSGLAVLAGGPGWLLAGGIMLFPLFPASRGGLALSGVLKRFIPPLALLVLPTLIWSAANGFPGWGPGESSTPPAVAPGLDYLRTAAWLGPFFSLLLPAGLGFSLLRAWRGDSLQRLLLLTGLPALAAYFLLTPWFSLPPAWAAPALFIVLTAGFFTLREYLTAGRLGRRLTWGAIGTGWACLAALTFFPSATTPWGLWLPPHPAYESLDWSRMGQAVERSLQRWKDGSPFLFGTDPAVAGLLAFYNPGRAPVEGLHLPGQEADQYSLWTLPDEFKGRDGLGVLHRRAYLTKLFNRAIIIREVKLKGSEGKTRITLTFYKCLDLKGSTEEVTSPAPGRP